MRKLSLIVALVVTTLLSGVLVLWGMFLTEVSSPASASSEQVQLMVPPDSSPEQIASLLESNGLIESQSAFVRYLRHFRTNATVKAGEYALAPMMTPAELAGRLERGAVVAHTITIAPGQRAEQVVHLLAQEGFGDQAKLRAAVRDRDLIARLGVPSNSLEGFLFPDVYNLSKGIEADALLKIFVDRYRKTVTPEIVAEAQAAGMAELELVTLASLIELDGIPAEERPLVAAVYHNRLKKSMKLENPGSVAYGLGKNATELTKEDLASDNAWNTYKKPGLPPTPITSPSAQSILAALRPAKSDALYFAPRGDGRHLFCLDEECHRIAIERWRREEAAKQQKP